MMCLCGLCGLCCAFGVSCAVCVDVVAVLLAVFVLSVLSVSSCFASAVGLVVIVCGVGVGFVGAVCVVCVVCCQFFCVSSSCVICFSCVSFSILCIFPVRLTLVSISPSSVQTKEKTDFLSSLACLYSARVGSGRFSLMNIVLSVWWLVCMVFCVSFSCLFHFLKVCLISVVLSFSIVFGVECFSCVFVVFFARLTSKS